MLRLEEIESYNKNKLRLATLIRFNKSLCSCIVKESTRPSGIERNKRQEQSMSQESVEANFSVQIWT